MALATTNGFQQQGRKGPISTFNANFSTMKFDELFLVHFNPIKAGGSESMYSLRGGRLALENRYRVEMHVHSPIFYGQLKDR